MNHEQTQRAISSYLRDELRADEQRDFLAHVRDCPRCSSELAIASRLHRELPQAAPYRASIGVPLPPALAARVRASVATQQRRKPLGWMEWLFPGAQPNLRRGVANVLVVFLILLTFAVGAVVLRNAFQPGPPRPGYPADFAYAAQQGLTYVFTDTTITNDTLTYRWDFGDGGSSNLRNPLHRYGGVGVYTVSIAVSGPLGTGNKSHGVSVGSIVAVTASPTPTALPSATAFLPGLSTATPVLLPMRDTATPPATDTPSLPSPPSPTLPSGNPLPPTSLPLPPAQPTALPPQPSATATLFPNNEPTGTPLPQSSVTPLPIPTETLLPQPTSTPFTAPSDTPLPLPTNTSTSTPLTVPTNVPSNTITPAPSYTPRSEPSSTPPPTPSSTPLPLPSDTPVIEPSNTPEPQPSDTPVIEPSNTPEPQPSDTPIATRTPDCGFHCGPTDTPVPPTHIPTDTPRPTETATPTSEPLPTHTPAPPTDTPTATPTHQPPPTWTPHDLTQTPGPTCTPQLGNDTDPDHCWHG